MLLSIKSETSDFEFPPVLSKDNAMCNSVTNIDPMIVSEFETCTDEQAADSLLQGLLEKGQYVDVYQLSHVYGNATGGHQNYLATACCMVQKDLAAKPGYRLCESCMWAIEAGDVHSVCEGQDAESREVSEARFAESSDREVMNGGFTL